ncbi:ABC transporter permease subunit [Bacillus suaedaesalsae]|uniref:ABC transporter permease subunit n=1 Tax=Bacillus suaedaesalsae TaxID=2810349 RepID=A0ABS2DL87_9BACI|nr:ABC transporter permease subunit [Bacillus suaedaesalsae]MBM6618795.1 ABC transporter permease subunit [Bacillus suaedaesalsae]
MIGSITILLFMLISILYTWILKDNVPAPSRYLHDKNGIVIDKAPFPPSLSYPLGSDKMGNNLFLMLIDGAKYTITLSIIVGVLRLFFGMILGFILLLFPAKFKSFIRSLFEGLHYFPLSLFSYMLAAPIFVFTWSFGEYSSIIGPLFIIILLSTPIIGVFISKEVERIYTKEFILNAKVMGGSWFHIFKTHVRPFFLPQLFIVLVQQIVQALLIFAHLGVLGVFLGGGKREEIDADILHGTPTLEVFSASNEWGGLIAKYFSEFLLSPNLILGPVFCFAIIVLALNFIVEGLKNVFIEDNMEIINNENEITTEDINVKSKHNNPYSLLKIER